ncbi:MAG: phosphate acyltransferase PlsX [Acidobacteria bacterium]|nr:MAG: phosphate acyltransferase PlsX [Acidobacteriota bacterium]
MTLKVAVDAMGGDHAPGFVVEGAVRAVREGGCQVVLVGRQDAIQAELGRLAAASLEGIEIAHASQVVEMGTESAAQALRQKKDSSIRVAARLVKEGRASALVSAGHTGAVMAAAKILLGSIEGVDRLPIAVTAPAVGGKVVILDAGANVDCKPHHFRQFAVMGYLYARVVLGVNNPRVGLLSIGEEDTKGTDVTREVFKVLRETRINFIGNIEGNDVYSGRVDVVVTDGFTGNVTLKVTESMIESLRSALRQEMARSLRTRLGALLMKPAFEGLEKRVDYAEYGGAPLLGARECVIICHGRSSPKAIKNAIGVAREFVERRVNERTAQEIRSLAEAETRLVG